MNWGKEVGKVFAGVVNWLIQMVNGITEFLQKLGKADKSKINLDGSKDNKNTKTDGSYRSGLDTVPYDGFIAELHKGESVLTKEDANVWRNYNTSSNSSVVVNYSPSITISNGDKTEFKRLLNQHKNEIAKLVEEVDYRKRARAYA